MKIIKPILSWLAIAAIIFAIYKYGLPTFPHMPGYLVLFFALSLSFTLIDKLHLGSVKPFNCVPCLTGWFSLIIAFVFHTEFWYLYLPAGLFVGSMFEGIKMRYL